MINDHFYTKLPLIKDKRKTFQIQNKKGSEKEQKETKNNREVLLSWKTISSKVRLFFSNSLFSDFHFFLLILSINDSKSSCIWLRYVFFHVVSIKKNVREEENKTKQNRIEKGSSLLKFNILKGTLCSSQMICFSGFCLFVDSLSKRI